MSAENIVLNNTTIPSSRTLFIWPIDKFLNVLYSCFYGNVIGPPFIAIVMCKSTYLIQYDRMVNTSQYLIFTKMRTLYSYFTNTFRDML